MHKHINGNGNNVCNFPVHCYVGCTISNDTSPIFLITKCHEKLFINKLVNLNIYTVYTRVRAYTFQPSHV